MLFGLSSSAPSAIQRRMRSISLAGQRRAALRHLGLAVVRLDQLQQMALFRLAGNNRRRPALAAAKKTWQGGHLVAALGLGRLMAAIAIGLKQRLDLFVN